MSRVFVIVRSSNCYFWSISKVLSCFDNHVYYLSPYIIIDFLFIGYNENKMLKVWKHKRGREACARMRK